MSEIFSLYIYYLNTSLIRITNLNLGYFKKVFHSFFYSNSRVFIRDRIILAPVVKGVLYSGKVNAEKSCLTELFRESFKATGFFSLSSVLKMFAPFYVLRFATWIKNIKEKVSIIQWR